MGIILIDNSDEGREVIQGVPDNVAVPDGLIVIKGDDDKSMLEGLVAAGDRPVINIQTAILAEVAREAIKSRLPYETAIAVAALVRRVMDALTREDVLSASLLDLQTAMRGAISKNERLSHAITLGDIGTLCAAGSYRPHHMSAIRGADELKRMGRQYAIEGYTSAQAATEKTSPESDPLRVESILKNHDGVVNVIQGMANSGRLLGSPRKDFGIMGS